MASELLVRHTTLTPSCARAVQTKEVRAQAQPGKKPPAALVHYHLVRRRSRDVDVAAALDHLAQYGDLSLQLVDRRF